MKRLLSCAIGLLGLGLLTPAIQADFDPSSAGGNDYTKKFYNNRDETTQGVDTIDRGTIFKKQANDSGMRDKLLKFLGLDPASLADGATGMIKGLLNAILAFAGLIALCYMIYGFVRIFFAAGDEAVKNARTIVRVSAIALAIIASARFLESFFFYVYEKISSPL